MFDIVRELAADSCQGARVIVVAGQVRNEQDKVPRPSDEELSAGLENLVQWLSQL